MLNATGHAVANSIYTKLKKAWTARHSRTRPKASAAEAAEQVDSEDDSNLTAPEPEASSAACDQEVTRTTRLPFRGTQFQSHSSEAPPDVLAKMASHASRNRYLTAFAP